MRLYREKRKTLLNRSKTHIKTMQKREEEGEKMEKMMINRRKLCTKSFEE